MVACKGAANLENWVTRRGPGGALSKTLRRGAWCVVGGWWWEIKWDTSKTGFAENIPKTIIPFAPGTTYVLIKIECPDPGPVLFLDAFTPSHFTVDEYRDSF